MKICGLNKTTLLDYPGRVAATIFLGGCNFRCPYCQNGDLVLRPQSVPEIAKEEILAFLKKRKGILEGVCITGGEPTLFQELYGFLEEINALGYPVKLDTNGSNPDMVKKLAERGLVQRVAMDIKASWENYPRVTGRPDVDTGAIRETADFLLSGPVDYEFRTTVAAELHSEEDFIRIGACLKGARAYFLQNYRESDAVIDPRFTPCQKETLNHYLDILRRTIPQAALRGID